MKRNVKFPVLFMLILALSMLVAVQVSAADKMTVRAENTDTGITLEWTEQDSIYYYEVYRQTGKSGERMLLSKVQGNTYTDEQAVNGQLCYYIIKAVYTDESRTSSTATAAAYRIGTAEITSVASEKEGIKIEWSIIKEALGYSVLRRSEGEAEWKTVTTCGRTTTAYIDKTADSSTKYYYAVRGIAGKFQGKESAASEISYIGYPKILGGSSTSEGVKLSWTAVEGVQYYYVYRQQVNEGVWKPYALLDAQYTSYEDTHADPGEDFSYTVRAVDMQGKNSYYDNPVVLRHIATPEIRKIEGSTKGVKVTWTKSDNCQGYALYKRGPGSADWKLAAIVKGADTLSAVDTRVVNSKVYNYTVRALWKNVLSDYDKQGTTFRYLEVPQQLVCDADTASGNVLKWSLNSEASTYLVYRKAVNGKKWSFIGQTSDNFYADKKAEIGAHYAYTVKAYSGSNYYSSVANAVATNELKYNPAKKMIALTFDDGPSDVHTNGILDVLEKYNAKATFFVVGENIYYGREAMMRAAKMGCEIGTHTYSHIDLPSSSDEEIEEEIRETDALVKEYTGNPTKIARAPGGEIDERSAAIVNKPFFYWNVDTRDWESQDSQAVIDIIMSETRDGDIILMHDVYDSTLEAVEYIVPWLVKQGYQLVTVSDLLYYKGKVRVQPAVTYYSGFGDTEYVERYE